MPGFPQELLEELPTGFLCLPQTQRPSAPCDHQPRTSLIWLQAAWVMASIPYPRPPGENKNISFLPQDLGTPAVVAVEMAGPEQPACR